MAERVVIDKGGRIVIPKALREALGLKEGDLVALAAEEGDLVIRPETEERGLVRRRGRLIKPAARGARVTTMDETLDAVDRLRRRGAPEDGDRPKKRRAG